MTRRLFSNTTALSLLCIGLGWASLPPANAKPKSQFSLLETLAEFRYPESQPLHGASVSDGATMRGGVRTVPSSRCEAILTTPDSFERVVAFYVQKFGITEEHAPPATPVDAPEGGAVGLLAGRFARTSGFTSHHLDQS
jgi:hypothetical protein